MFTLVEKLTNHIADRRFTKFRQLYYTALPNLPKVDINPYLQTLALSMDMHPACLGVMLEPSARIMVGADVGLQYWHVLDWYQAVAKFHDSTSKTWQRDGTNVRLKKIHGEEAIESRIVHIDRPKNLKTVIVIEHRNLFSQAGWLEDSMKNSMIILVCITLIGGNPADFGRPVVILASMSGNLPTYSALQLRPSVVCCSSPIMIFTEHISITSSNTDARDLPGRPR